MEWTEGDVWTVTTSLHADDSYEYKYIIARDDPSGAFDPAAAVWQTGNNKSLALHDTLHDSIELVEVVDSWWGEPPYCTLFVHSVHLVHSSVHAFGPLVHSFDPAF